MGRDELDQIEQQLEVLRVTEAEVRARCWERFDALMQPARAWLERICEHRLPTTREEDLYRERLNRAYAEAMIGLAPIPALASEAAKLRTRRANLLYRARKAA